MRTQGTQLIALSLLLMTLMVGSNIPRGAAVATSSAFVDRASVSSNNAQGNAGSTVAAITPDGRFVLFGSSASNLVLGDTNGFMDAFVHDRLTGTTERVSVSSSGAQGNGDSMTGDLAGDGGAITPDGRFVAFNSLASNLVPGDVNGVGDVFVRDRVTGTTEIVSVNSSGVQGNFGSGIAPPSISGNGTLVAFDSQATNLEPGQNGQEGVFVHNRITGKTIEVSVNSSGVEGNGFSLGPTISRDGRFVVFFSFASNLVSGDTNGAPDIFVRNLSAGTTERVSVDSSGVEGNGGSGGPLDLPDISADGRFVAFSSTATNLVPGDTNNVDDAYVHDESGISADLSVAKTSAPNPVAVRKQLNYTITIPNNGPNGTPYVNMSDSLPTTVLFLSVTSTQGSCIFTGKGAGGTVSCNIGFIPSAGMVTIIIAVKPTKIGTITNTVAVTGHLPDPNLANNVATVQTTVVKKL